MSIYLCLPVPFSILYMFFFPTISVYLKYMYLFVSLFFLFFLIAPLESVGAITQLIFSICSANFIFRFIISFKKCNSVCILLSTSLFVIISLKFIFGIFL